MFGKTCETGAEVEVRIAAAVRRVAKVVAVVAVGAETLDSLTREAAVAIPCEVMAEVDGVVVAEEDADEDEAVCVNVTRQKGDLFPLPSMSGEAQARLKLL
ncbi:hypothetical protein M8818_006421 [Zalaria obscura]|uniref:Uncharacterized protein n=1 Tax=Zalaria obscura TaxID=2024903 RepID=A0ACC3SA50_9PEZI